MWTKIILLCKRIIFNLEYHNSVNCVNLIFLCKYIRIFFLDGHYFLDIQYKHGYWIKHYFLGTFSYCALVNLIWLSFMNRLYIMEVQFWSSLYLQQKYSHSSSSAVLILSVSAAETFAQLIKCRCPNVQSSLQGVLRWCQFCTSRDVPGLQKI